MPLQNSSNQKFTNNADGFVLGGGTTQRNLTVSGANITLTGSGGNTYTLPSTGDTLIGRSTPDTLTNKTINTNNNLLGNLIDANFSASAAIAMSKIGIGQVNGTVNGTATSTIVWRGSQAQYDAIGSKDSNTIYTIVPGPPVTYIESTSISNTGGNTTPNRTQSLSLPPNRQVGDLMIIITSLYNGNATTPAGWTAGVSTTGTTQRLTLFYRICDGTEASAVTLVVGVSDSTLHHCLLFRNMHTNPALLFDASATNSTTSSSTAQITPFLVSTPDSTPERSLVLRCVTTYGATGASNYTWPGGWAEIIDAVAVTSGDATLAWISIAIQLMPNVGMLDAVTATSNINQRYSSFTLVINGIQG